jgi:transcription elongation factor GreA
MTLNEAARNYFGTLDDGHAATRAEVERFIRWVGANKTFDQIRGQEVANYADQLTGAVTDANDRADAVRKFLAYAKKSGFSQTNLGTHLRVRKATVAKPRASRIEEIEMTVAEKAALETELAELKAQRPRIVEDLHRAMSDKDFRENAPLDAAKDRQAYVEGRIRSLEAKLDHSVIVETSAPTSNHVIEVGSTVVLHNLSSGKNTTYTLVRPSEVNATEGRISFESPVGRALLAHAAGEEVEVAIPSGTVRFRIERIEG